MQTYLMLGHYEGGALEQIGSARTTRAVGLIEELDGQVIALYGLLGEYDLAMIVNLPANLQAMQASVQLRQATGIQFVTLPALSIDRYDEFLSQAPDIDLSEGLDLLDEDLGD